MGNSNNLKVIAAIAAGVLAGTAMGLLLAPAKGNETRSKLMSGAKDAAGKLKKKLYKDDDTGALHESA